MIPTDREAELVALAKSLSRLVEVMGRIIDRLLGRKPRVPRVTLVLTVHPEEEDPHAYRH